MAIQDFVQIQFEGEVDLRKKIQLVPEEYRKRVYRGGLRTAAAYTLRQARRRVAKSKRKDISKRANPRHLKNSGKIQSISWRYDGKKYRHAAYQVKFLQPHAHLVELGTVKMKAKPFLEPALRDSGGILNHIHIGMARAFKRVNRQIARKKLG